jgi:hypothetical protein
MSKSYDPRIIRLEARIVGIEPAITRTLELPRDLNFAQLHEVLQAAFGWTDSHLHQFYVGGLTIGAPEAIEDSAYGPGVRGDRSPTQGSDLPYEVDPTLTITYQYDFGDNWQHKLVLHRAGRRRQVSALHRRRAGRPARRCGRIPRLCRLSGGMACPEHEEHKAMRRWAGKKFDPERFDLDATNKAIAKAMRACNGDYRQRQI